jgi:hypothetical protein
MKEDDYIQKYIKYVSETIDKYQKYNSLDNEHSEVTPQEVNEALSNFLEVKNLLLYEYGRKKAEFKMVSLDYDAWWDSVYVAMRKELNPINLAASKWLAKQEIESEVKVRYSELYREWQLKLFQAEEEFNMVRKILEGWIKFDSILMTLSYNMRSDMKTLTIANRMNRTEDKMSYKPQSRLREVVDIEEL